MSAAWRHLSTTRVPELAVAGGVPGARRIITPAKSASPGLLQDSDTLLPGAGDRHPGDRTRRRRVRRVVVDVDVGVGVVVVGVGVGGGVVLITREREAEVDAAAPCQALVTTR